MNNLPLPTHTIKPAFKKSICICLSSDDNYALYLGVTVQSIKANKSSDDKYDIFILDGGISEDYKKRFQKLADASFSVRFINIDKYLGNIDKSIFSLNAHFTIAAYYRIFIPQIFSDFDKVLYLDCDLVVHNDVAKLYNTDMENHAIAAVYDTEILRTRIVDGHKKGGMFEYMENVLKMKPPFDYFQSGVLLFDIAKLKNMDFTNKCLEKLIEIKNPIFVDQCVLNSLFDGDYKKIDIKWNVMWHIPYYVKNLNKQLPITHYNEYIQARENPHIIHYSGPIKPWKNMDVELADIWWHYAHQTPFYEEILCKNITNQIYAISNDIFNYNKNKHKYYRYKLLSKLTFGKTRKHYKKKRKELKQKLKEIKTFLNK